jgi:hypothetical protein
LAFYYSSSHSSSLFSQFGDLVDETADDVVACSFALEDVARAMIERQEKECE